MERKWGGKSIREPRRDRALVLKGYPSYARVMVYDRKTDEHLGIKITIKQAVEVAQWFDQYVAQQSNVVNQTSPDPKVEA